MNITVPLVAFHIATAIATATTAPNPPASFTFSVVPLVFKVWLALLLFFLPVSIPELLDEELEVPVSAVQPEPVAAHLPIRICQFPH